MHGGLPECPVDLDGVEQLRQRERFGHLDPHPRRARGGGLNQPQPGAFTQVEELSLCRVLRAGPAIQRTGRLGWEVLVVDPRGAGRGPRVAGDLDRPVVADVDDDDLLLSPTPWVRTHTAVPSSDSPFSWCGTEYWPDSNITIGVFAGT